jgi:hypothetical protein
LVTHHFDSQHLLNDSGGMSKPTHITAPVAAAVARVSERTLGRWARCYGLHAGLRPGCTARGRLIEVARLEALIGRPFTPEQISAAAAQHDTNKESRNRRLAARKAAMS